MNQSSYLTGPTILVGVVSIVNICLLMAAVFSGEGSGAGVKSAARVKLGYVAVSLGLCSQVLYGLMVAALFFGWVPNPGESFHHLEASLARTGVLLSAATLFTALFGRGLRRYVGLWVACTTWFLWGTASLGALLGGG